MRGLSAAGVLGGGSDRWVAEPLGVAPGRGLRLYEQLAGEPLRVED